MARDSETGRDRERQRERERRRESKGRREAQEEKGRRKLRMVHPHFLQSYALCQMSKNLCEQHSDRQISPTDILPNMVMVN
eukprot:CAMPEP_0116561700 /NCGR_PEP_ID=MMETSP0397-20121206/11731_1 /TAXON_ID=216820 /ORGANISM="Cyclophora tenuis, Strain ECT3854" /LENGTH=80 /DNA_ID=CAMNT_0004087877 /DNA_START=114 /DNA_END=353 /DNA_ORIENTATION=+